MRDFMIMCFLLVMVFVLAKFMINFSQRECVEKGGYKVIGGNAFICVDRKGNIVP